MCTSGPGYLFYFPDTDHDGGLPNDAVASMQDAMLQSDVMVCLVEKIYPGQWNSLLRIHRTGCSSTFNFLE